MVNQFITWYEKETGDLVSATEKHILEHWESWRNENPSGTAMDFANERADVWLHAITLGELTAINEFEEWKKAQ